MQAALKVIHSSRLYPLHNGQATLRYVGYKYPESQWVGLLNKNHACTTKLTEIGRIILEAEATGPLYELEQKLLTMAKLYGANIVLIDYLKSIEIKSSNEIINPNVTGLDNNRIKNDKNNNKKNRLEINNCVHICGRCQRFDE